MSKTVTIPVCLCFFVLGVGLAIQAQDKAVSQPVSAAAKSNLEQDGLNGPVRRVRLETAQIVVRDGKSIEGRRQLRGVATYDSQGRKIDDAAYPVEGSSLAGKKQYRYDEKGNIIEMVARRDDGSILTKESYKYEFDELGNWKKMTTSVAVYEDGMVSYEPTEVSYRTITYYYGQAIDKLASGLRADASPTSNASPKTSTSKKDSTRIPGAAESARTANAIGSPVSGNQAKNGAVKESSVATVGDGLPYARVEETKNAVLNPPKTTAKIPAGASSTELSGENKKIKNAERDETSSTLISSTRTALSSNASDSSGLSLYQEGLGYLAAGAYQQAVEAFNQSISLNPNDASVYLKLGSAYYALRKYKEVVNGLKMAIRIKPEIVNAAAYYYLGYAYTELGNHKDALEAFNQALYLTRAEVIDKDEANERSSPALEQIHYGLGLSYLHLRRYQEAIKELSEAVELNPKLAEAYYVLGIAYLRLRDRSSAQRQHRTLISLNAALAKQLADAISTPNMQDFPCSSLNFYSCR